MKHKPYILISLLFVSSLAVMTACHSNTSSGDHNRAATLMKIDVALPVVDSIVLHRSFPGYLAADKNLDIVARVNGYLVGKYFTDGEFVRKGEKLFSIEDTQYRDQLQQAQAQLQSAIATNEYATKHYHAMKKALESDAVSQMDVIQAESALNESKAAIESAKAAVQTARTTLGYCTVYAPFEGKVAAPRVSEGDYLAGGGSPVTLTTIFNDKIVKANISIEDALYLAILDNMKNNSVDYDSIPVAFADTLPHKYFGKLSYVAPNIDQSTGSLNLKVEIDNPYGELKSGMYAMVYLPFATDPEAIMVKDASIGTDQQGKYLYTLSDSNSVVYTPIEIGEIVNDSMRIVKKGIDRDTRYVTKALLKVREGMTVDPVMSK
ncbi:MAG: efflux RND transporter periplasmic adaptor subunit [Bacteroidales bacterium]|nr:efflux RND transporter periplasmic adaptor subunit [Bacteroidales bacterium]